MGSANSAITIHVNGTQPFVTGQEITGIVMFNNTLEKNLKVHKICAEFIGETIHITKKYNGSEFLTITHHNHFFEQSITLEEKQEDFALNNGPHSWPFSFSLPASLPPSLNQLVLNGPYVHYKLRVVFERSEKYRMNIHQKFPVHLISHPSSYMQPSFFPAKVENTNRSDVTLHATLINQNGHIMPGDTVSLDTELKNPNHAKIKSLSIDLVQYRTLWKAGQCSLNIPVSKPPDLQEFSGENYHETLQLVIPDDDRVIPSFHYLPASVLNKPIAIEYAIKLEVKVHGFFNDLILKIPVVVHGKESYTKSSNEDEVLSLSSGFAFTAK